MWACLLFSLSSETVSSMYWHLVHFKIKTIEAVANTVHGLWQVQDRARVHIFLAF